MLTTVHVCNALFHDCDRDAAVVCFGVVTSAKMIYHSHALLFFINMNISIRNIRNCLALLLFVLLSSSLVIRKCKYGIQMYLCL